ncbi:putative non-specific serine/threonine protein kinase [Helianthus annuus]|nr:putative non-specific serine/threonine protein kinase [Helianthus annuus]KAJ0701409.1 putative non-specific serine/threonine protein kinase [Helianthus annuus]
MLIFETITGKSIENLSYLALDKHLGFADYIHKNWLEGTLSDIIDPRIDADSVSMTKFVEIGLLCVQGLAADRPTMEEVIGMLLGTSSLTFHVSEMRERMMFNGVTPYFSSNLDRCINEDYDISAVEAFISELCPR